MEKEILMGIEFSSSVATHAKEACFLLVKTAPRRVL